MENLVLQNASQQMTAFTEAREDLNEQMAQNYKTIVEDTINTILNLYPKVKAILIGVTLIESELRWGIELEDDTYPKICTSGNYTWNPRDDLLMDRWFCPDEMVDPPIENVKPEAQEMVTQICEAMTRLTDGIRRNTNTHMFAFGDTPLCFNRSGISQEHYVWRY